MRESEDALAASFGDAVKVAAVFRDELLRAPRPPPPQREMSLAIRPSGPARRRTAIVARWFTREPTRENIQSRERTDEIRGRIVYEGPGGRMGISDPETRKKFSEPRWLQYKHESQKQSWPFWKRLIHRFQTCPFCRPEMVNNNNAKAKSGNRD